MAHKEEQYSLHDPYTLRRLIYGGEKVSGNETNKTKNMKLNSQTSSNLDDLLTGHTEHPTFPFQQGKRKFLPFSFLHPFFFPHSLGLEGIPSSTSCSSGQQERPKRTSNKTSSYFGETLGEISLPYLTLNSAYFCKESRDGLEEKMIDLH